MKRIILISFLIAIVLFHEVTNGQLFIDRQVSNHFERIRHLVHRLTDRKSNNKLLHTSSKNRLKSGTGRKDQIDGGTTINKNAKSRGGIQPPFNYPDNIQSIIWNQQKESPDSTAAGSEAERWTNTRLPLKALREQTNKGVVNQQNKQNNPKFYEYPSETTTRPNNKFNDQLKVPNKVYGHLQIPNESKNQDQPQRNNNNNNPTNWSWSPKPSDFNTQQLANSYSKPSSDRHAELQLTFRPPNPQHESQTSNRDLQTFNHVPEPLLGPQQNLQRSYAAPQNSPYRNSQQGSQGSSFISPQGSNSNHGSQGGPNLPSGPPKTFERSFLAPQKTSHVPHRPLQNSQISFLAPQTSQIPNSLPQGPQISLRAPNDSQPSNSAPQGSQIHPQNSQQAPNQTPHGTNQLRQQFHWEQQQNSPQWGPQSSQTFYDGPPPRNKPISHDFPHHHQEGSQLSFSPTQRSPQHPTPQASYVIQQAKRETFWGPEIPRDSFQQTVNNIPQTLHTQSYGAPQVPQQSSYGVPQPGYLTQWSPETSYGIPKSPYQAYGPPQNQNGAAQTGDRNPQGPSWPTTAPTANKCTPITPKRPEKIKIGFREPMPQSYIEIHSAAEDIDLDYSNVAPESNVRRENNYHRRTPLNPASKSLLNLDTNPLRLNTIRSTVKSLRTPIGIAPLGGSSNPYFQQGMSQLQFQFQREGIENVIETQIQILGQLFNQIQEIERKPSTAVPQITTKPKRIVNGSSILIDAPSYVILNQRFTIPEPNSTDRSILDAYFTFGPPANPIQFGDINLFASLWKTARNSSSKISLSELGNSTQEIGDTFREWVRRYVKAVRTASPQIIDDDDEDEGIGGYVEFPVNNPPVGGTGFGSGFGGGNQNPPPPPPINSRSIIGNNRLIEGEMVELCRSPDGNGFEPNLGGEYNAGRGYASNLRICNQASIGNTQGAFVKCFPPARC